jgi:hypothetical protein
MTMEEAFARLGHLAGYRDALTEHGLQLGLIATAVEQLHEEGDDLMSVAQVLKDASAAVAQAATDVKAAIDAAIARLSDNPTTADIAEVVSNLTAAGGTLGAAAEAAATIDPDAPTGVVADGSGGVTEAPPADTNVV